MVEEETRTKKNIQITILSLLIVQIFIIKTHKIEIRLVIEILIQIIYFDFSIIFNRKFFLSIY